MENFDLNNEAVELDAAVEMPAIEEVQITDDEISFGKHGKIHNKEFVAEAAIPVAAAVVVEEAIIPVAVEEVTEAPVAVIDEPDPVYNAPMEEPVRHVRWPWALLALPLLAIPFIHGTTTTPVAEPVVVATPIVRTVAMTPMPPCAGEWFVKEAVVMKATAAPTSESVATLAANTKLDVAYGEEAGYYKVNVNTDDGYVPVDVVVCQVATTTPERATTTVTG